MTNVSGDYAITTTNAYGTTGVIVAGTGLYTGSTGMRITNSAGGTIHATEGAGLSVANATIGGANLSFTSISAGGGANGILLHNAGTSGALQVLGTGTAGSGRTIQNTTADAIALTNTALVSLSRMNVTQSGENGILGSNVTGLSLADCVFTGNDDDSGDDGIRVTNLLGSCAWSNVQVTGSERNDVTVINSSGTGSLTVTGGTFSSVSTLNGDDGVLAEASGSAVLTVVCPEARSRRTAVITSRSRRWTARRSMSCSQAIR